MLSASRARRCDKVNRLMIVSTSSVRKSIATLPFRDYSGIAGNRRRNRKRGSQRYRNIKLGAVLAAHLP